MSPASKIKGIGEKRQENVENSAQGPIINNRNSRKSKQRNGREEIKELIQVNFQESKDMYFNGKTH